jgi:RNA polymerase sigma-70 factor, ECF subfamily
MGSGVRSGPKGFPTFGIYSSVRILARRQRTDRAFERLYRKHVLDVYRYAVVLLSSPPDAEDVTQTTFRNAYPAFKRGERPRRARNWLISIAHGICLQRFRHVAQSAGLLQDEAELAVPDDEAPTAADIRRALGQLSFDQRAALVMREIEGRSYREVAQILGVSVADAESLVFRARRALRERLEGSLTCHEAERAISLQLDRRLKRSERRTLRAHLRQCEDCTRFSRSQRAQREALRNFANVPLPSSLGSFFGSAERPRSDALVGVE